MVLNLSTLRQLAVNRSTMNDVVIFDSAKFKTLYPQFENVADATLELYFKAACLLCDNTKNSRVKDLGEREMLLYMLTCHITTLKQQDDTLVGTITAAAEGSVNVSVAPFNNANWYNSTQCGAMYWAATAKYRVGMRYYAYNKC